MVASLFADEGVYITPGGNMLASRQAMEKAVAGRIQAGWTKQTTRITEAHAAGASVWFVGEYTLSGTGEANGKRFGGYMAEVLMRQSSEWRTHLLIGNRRPTQEVLATPDTALPKQPASQARDGRCARLAWAGAGRATASKCLCK